MVRALVSLMALLIAAASAFAQEGWTITTADFTTEPVSLIGIDDKGVRVADAAGKERVLALSQFLQIERAATAANAPAGDFMLHMTGGDRVGGEPVSMEGDRLIWKNPSVGEVPVPLSRLIAMTQPGQSPPEGRTTEDIVTLANGDSVRGIITAIADGVLSVKTETGDTVPVPVGSVASVQFAATPGGAGGGDKGYRVRLDDGSSIVVDAVKTSGKQVELTLGDGAPRSLPTERLVAIESVNGPAVFLSAREPEESVYVPFFGSAGEFPARMNQTVGGSRELRFGGRTFRRAIGVHSYSRLSWPLDGSFAAFRTQYAVNENLPGADMTVRILLDGKVVHEQENVGSGTLSPVVTVELGDAKQISLEVDYGRNIHINDRLTWLEPALLRNKPAKTK